MADKFIIHNATYCGDGTASNEAASDGAAGAWNNINVFEGTAPAYGSLAAGDTVYIRSKDAGGNNITRAVAAATTLGSAAGTTASPVTWVLDNGDKWGGVDGILTYTSANTSYNFVIRANNIVESKTQSALRFVSTVAAPNSSTALVSVLGILKKPRIDWSAKTNSNNLVMMDLGDVAVVEYPELELGNCGTVLGYSAYGTITSASTTIGGRQKVIGIDYKINGAGVGQPLIGPRQYSSFNIEFVGGQIYGPGANAPGAKFADAISANDCLCYSVGLKIPRTMVVFGGYTMPSLLELVACEDGYGGHVEEVWGGISTRTDNNPPTRNTTLPDSASTKWAARVYPSRTTAVKPMIYKMLKTYSGASAIKTVNLELQVSDDFSPQPTSSTLWMDVTYTDDTTGLEKKCTTFDASAAELTAGATDWSSNGWYLTSLTPKRLSITTPTSIRQDTPIIVTLFGTTPALSETQVYFVDADFDLL